MQDPHDPKGLIRESYRIEGITLPECRSIFLDWALSVDAAEVPTAVRRLLMQYRKDAPMHPMTATLEAALQDAGPARRRGGRAARLRDA